MRRLQRGASGLLVLVILVLVAVSVLATSLLSRIGLASDDQNNSYASLNRAAVALDAFAGATMRLPCPANPSDPAGDVGVEVTSGAAGCQFSQGTVPWKTIGLSRNDAYDAWGHKISYRVYLGSAGSLVQPGGASMADCDTNEAGADMSATPASGGVGGLCKPGTTVPGISNPDTSLRTTTPAQFLAGKGLTLTDFGVVHNDVAYVLMSHGATGLGSYSSSGVQLDIPKGDEKSNLNDTGPFSIEAFSDSDTGATNSKHFDDLLVYRTISDLAKRANLAARNWPDTILSAVTFDKTTLSAALGSNPGSDTGQSTIAFNNATVSAFNSSGAQDISYVHGGGNPDAIGGVSGSDGGLLGSAGGEGVQINFAEDARQFAFTVDQFDDASTLHERLQLLFFEVVGSTATLKNTMIEPSCSSNGKFTSFSVDACAAFNRVEIRPISMTDGTSPSSFTLAEIRTCTDSVTCQTDLQASGSGNVCSTKTFVPCSIGTNDPTVLTITLSNPSSSNMTGAAFTDSYPTGLVNAAIPSGSNTCGGTATASGGGTTLTLAAGTIPANSTCTVSVNVTASTVGAYNNMTSDVTTTSAGSLAGVSQTLSVLTHPGVSLAFSPATVSRNTSASLTIALANTNATDITGVAFTDVYPGGIANAASPGASTTCGAGTVVAIANSPQVSLSGGTIPPGGCTVTVSVSSASIGSYTNAIAAGAIASGNAGANTAGASASLAVN